MTQRWWTSASWRRAWANATNRSWRTLWPPPARNMRGQTHLRRCTCGQGSRPTRSKPGQPRSFSFSAVTVRPPWTGRAFWVTGTSSSASCPRTRRTSSCQVAATEHRRTRAGTFQSSRQCSQTLCAKGPYSPQRSKCGKTARANGASISRQDVMRNWRTSSSWPPSSRSTATRAQRLRWTLVDFS